MLRLKDHPTVRKVLDRGPASSGSATLDRDALRALCLEAGADDVGFVELERVVEQRDDILAALPGTRTLVSIVVRMNREPIRSTARSVANLEFHHAGDAVNEVGRRIVQALEERGVRALNPAMGFPMEMDRFPGKTWVVSHKPVAVAAGLGAIGVHRNLIHPRFGNFVLLGTVLVAAALDSHDRAIDFNPCLSCKLCVAACPVGAIKQDGAFDFSACYTHNYREFMGGFTDWVEQIADSSDARDYRRQVTDAESASMWQSLSFGANYKAAYCLSVCPAGEDVIGPWLSDPKEHLERVVRPLQKKQEPVYVARGTDAEEHVARRFPHKPVRHVDSGLRPTTIRGFIDGLRLVFQRGRAGDLDATYHFRFTGGEAVDATVVIRRGVLTVEDGHRGSPDLSLTADGATWIAFLRKDRGIALPLLTGRIRVRGPLRLLRAFQACLPL